MRSKTPERRVTDLYSPQQLARIRTCVETVLNELEMSYESLASAINRAAGEHRCTKDSLNRLARIGKDVERGAATNQALMILPDLAFVTRIYTEEDLKAIALGNPPISAIALEYHPEDRVPGPIEERVRETLSSAGAEKERMIAIERALEIVVGEIRSTIDRLGELERSMESKKKEWTDGEIYATLRGMMTGEGETEILDLLSVIDIADPKAVVEFTLFLSQAQKTLSPFLRECLIRWLENNPKSPLKRKTPSEDVYAPT